MGTARTVTVPRVHDSALGLRGIELLRPGRGCTRRRGGCDPELGVAE